MEKNNGNIYIGTDNGATGTISFVTGVGKGDIYHTPVKKELNYTKEAKFIHRIDHTELYKLISERIIGFNPIAILERPMVNPRRFSATLSAVRVFEATLVVLETLGIPYCYIDSKEWQREMLPKGIKGDTELKEASLSVGNRLFPDCDSFKHNDRDSLLIAEYYRR